MGIAREEGAKGHMPVDIAIKLYSKQGDLHYSARTVLRYRYSVLCTVSVFCTRVFGTRYFVGLVMGKC